jgi:hypothetical protein
MDIFKPVNGNGLDWVAPRANLKYRTRALEVITFGIMVGTLVGAILKLGF